MKPKTEQPKTGSIWRDKQDKDKFIVEIVEHPDKTPNWVASKISGYQTLQLIPLDKFLQWFEPAPE